MNRLKEARIAKDFSQKEIAAKMDVSAATVSEWESGKKNPTLENARTLSNIFNLPMDYLFPDDQEKDYFAYLRNKRINSNMPVNYLCILYDISDRELEKTCDPDVLTETGYSVGFNDGYEAGLKDGKEN